MSQKRTQSYMTLHSPRGAAAHFGLGLYGKGGGFGLEQARIAANDVYIGIHRNNQITCLPFYKDLVSTELASFLGEQEIATEAQMLAFPEEVIERDHQWGSDSWKAPGVEFTLHTPVDGIPDPKTAQQDVFKRSINPAILAQFTIDNTDGKEAVTGIFGLKGLDGRRPTMDESDGKLMGWVGNGGFGFACDAVDNPTVMAAAHHHLTVLFTAPHPIPFRLGSISLLLVEVAPGEKKTVDIALGWYINGAATFGQLQMPYAYTDHYSGLIDVLSSALANKETILAETARVNQDLKDSGLNVDQQFMIAEATSSYWASSMLFNDHGKHRWVVNEGTYLMLNTFDLAVDQQFFELRQHPWVVQNILDGFVENYSYNDTLHFPGGENVHPGGISFTHDQGAENTFTPRGFSSYEVTNQPGCYAYMTQEQLVNWLVTAGTYVEFTNDQQWAETQAEVIKACLPSMLNRDNPDPVQRNGIMSLDSSRAGATDEITTYDSLDPSLGQSRENLYLAVKSWGAYLALVKLLKRLGEEGLAAQAEAAAQRVADTVSSSYDEQLGYIPAILDGVDQSPIIPAIEGLIFPYWMGMKDVVSPDGPYGAMVKVLKQHLENVLKPGLCLFDDGSWRVSAHSVNSWISKIFLCQYIAREILGFDFGEAGAVADRAHADWWRVGCASCAAIDQIFAGTTTEEGFYYPRAVTSLLWMMEG